MQSSSSSRIPQIASTSNVNDSMAPASESGISTDVNCEMTGVVRQEEENDKPQKKKRKPDTSKTTKGKQPSNKYHGKRGKLQKLIEMPIDILFEIFGALEPHDLLKITRTSKALRAILMSRSSLTVWKRARSNVPGLPDCPEGISEPLYARLMFEVNCHECGKAPKVPCVISWEARARFCSGCISDQFNEFAPVFQWGTPSLITVESYGRRSHHRRDVKWYHKKTANILRVEYESLADKEAKGKWFSEREEKWRAVMKQGKLCEAWLEQKDALRTQSLEDIKIKRIEQITEKLKQAGWEDELEDPNQHSKLCSHPLVAQKKVLTDRAWLTKLQPALDQFMHSIKAERIERLENKKLETRQLLIKKLRETHIAACPINTIIPPAADIYLYRPFRTVVETNPTEEEFTIDRFEHAMTLLPDFIVQWRKDKEAELMKMMPEELIEARCSGSLNLATAIFSCEYCNSRFTYLRALAHHHPFGYSESLPSDMDPEKKRLFQNLREGTWNYKNRIKFDLSAHAKAEELVKLCGLDPKSTTYQEMNEANPIFECTSCYRDVAGRLVMGWETGVKHKCSSSYTAPHIPHLVLIKDEKVEMTARAGIEQERLRVDAKCQGHSDQFCCAICRKTSSMLQLKEHVRQEHGGKVRREDIIPCIDANHCVGEVRIMMDEWDE